MHVGDSVSRRTRSRWDAFYRRQHEDLKKKSDHKINNTRRGKRSVLDDCEEQSFESSNKSFFKKRRRKNVECIINISVDSSMDGDADDSEDEDSSDDDEQSVVGSDEDYKEKGSRKNKNLDSYFYLKKGKRSKKVTSLSKKKACLIEESDLINILEDSIWKEKDLEKGALPLKFQFEEDCQSSYVEKTDWEKEIDSLFDEMEMALWECRNEGTDTSMTGDDECHASTDNDESPAARCRRGEHDLVLDEQVGLVCEYCRSVMLEIKYILPPFDVGPLESPEKKGMVESDDSTLDQIQFQGSICGKLESSLHSKGTVLELIPDTNKELYPHQLEGFEFLWRNIAGDIHIDRLEQLSANGGRGCIISHAPGTGKTRLTIVFVQTFLKLYPSCRPVIVAPRGMLLTWEQEFKKWKVDFNFHNLNEKKLSSEETAFAASVVDQARVNKTSRDYIRFIKLYSWMKGGGILGIGYRLFEELAGDNPKKRCNDKFKKILLELPDLLVLDEGHTPRNHQSLMWKALTNVVTQRRIILSGTPFQNNFSELYNTLCLVNPRFSHQIMSANHDSNFRKRPGEKSKVNEGRYEWAYLTSSVSNDATGEDSLKKLRSMIEPFVHIHKGSILQTALPGLRDCLIVLKPTDLQSKLLQDLERVDSFIELVYLSSLISVHPSLAAEKPEFSDYRRKLKSVELNSKAGVKTHFLIKLIQLSVHLHEKVLVFSEFIDPLHHIQKLLKHQFSWNEGREVIHMDGNLSIKQRQHMINLFNDKKSEAKVLLASQRACCEGINLVGASRVVLLDVVWNPSVERQAICRAYRLGQEKMVYVYHLVTGMEVKKYSRQAEKERISELIFCPGIERKSSSPSNKLAGFEDKVLEAMVGQHNLGSMFEKIIHQPKESDLVNSFGFVDLK